MIRISAFVKAYPDTADQIFNEHWYAASAYFFKYLFIQPRSTWFNQEDVDELVRLGINTVRIPVSRKVDHFIVSANANISCQLGY